ncbi:MAG: hypothetical protein EP338_03295 [Bacteroidetes bacterium]|nr:MAG: hypothetical protein EP338_03295 [Bacteroidota bacterium]
MSKKFLLIFGVVIAALTAALWYFLRDPGGANGGGPVKLANWEEKYDIDGQGPRGLQLFREMLEYRTKKNSVKFETRLVPESLNEKKTYLFIGEKFQLKTSEFDSLMDQVRNGANLLVAYEDVSDFMHRYWYGSDNLLWDYSDHVGVSFGEDYSFRRLYHVHQSDTIAKTWQLMDYHQVRRDVGSNFGKISPLSFVKGHTNFISYEVGDGRLMVHCNPELFQNYQLLSQAGYDYAQYVASMIPEEHQICWLELGKLDDEDLGGDRDGGKKDESYLQFIFKHKELTIALLLIVLGLILFLVFRTKRTQPYVPYLPKTMNHSLSFAETLKEIYYRKQTPYSILQVMRRNFEVAVNKQFFVDLKGDRQKMVHTLSEKSNVDQKEIEELLRMLEIESESAVNYEYLHKVSTKQRAFYIQSGILKEKQEERSQLKTMRIQRKMLIPVSLIFIGIIGALYGFYLLYEAESVGILLWPIGGLLLAFGVRMVSVPLMKIQKETLTFYQLFGPKKVRKQEDMLQVRMENGICSFVFEDGMERRIPINLISAYDQKAFEQFVSPYLKQKI